MPCAFNPCPLEINSNGGLKREHLESSSSGTKNMSQLPQCLGHQTWQGGDLPRGALINKIRWPFHHEVWQDHVTNENHYFSTTRVPMTTKFGRMVTYLDGLLPTKSYGFLISWSSRSRDKPKLLYLHSHSAYCHHTWWDGEIPWEALNHTLI